MQCPDCGTEVSASRMSCPLCQRLLHKEELEQLAAEARAAGKSGEIRDEITAWRRALELLPPDSRQYAAVTERVSELSREINAAAGQKQPPATGGRHGWRWAGFGALGLLVWKLKSVVALVLTKGKFILAGLTKSSTFFSMLLSLGVYWTAFGWKFALGLIGSIYIHEMGHVAALHRFGIKASPPMFVPGVGAFVRLGQYPVDPGEDARVGLAGPLWGLAAAIAAYLVFLATGTPIWGAIARVGAWINLFNLLPVWQLDGGRGFRSLSRPERGIITLLLIGLWFFTGEGLLVLLFLAAAFRWWAERAPGPGDRAILLRFGLLALALSLMCLIDVPTA